VTSTRLKCLVLWCPKARRSRRSRFETESGNVSGAASISASGNDVVVEVNLQSTGPVEWELGYDSDAWTLERIDRQGTAISAFAANRGTIQGLHTGEGRLTMTFAGSADAAERVVLRVLEGGQPVFRGYPVHPPLISQPYPAAGFFSTLHQLRQRADVVGSETNQVFTHRPRRKCHVKEVHKPE
jgi:hypothetical protein